MRFDSKFGKSAIELLSSISPKLLYNPVKLEGRPVRAVGCHRVQRVSNHYDAGPDRNAFAS